MKVTQTDQVNFSLDSAVGGSTLALIDMQLRFKELPLSCLLLYHALYSYIVEEFLE